MIDLYVCVTTVINNWAVPELDGKPATWEGTQRMDPKKLPVKKQDAYSGLNPNGAARVRMGFEEKLSGPAGTYSSISIRIEVEARCDQNEEAILKARNILGGEGLKALEHYAGPALNVLVAHTEKGPR